MAIETSTTLQELQPSQLEQLARIAGILVAAEGPKVTAYILRTNNRALGNQSFLELVASDRPPEQIMQLADQAIGEYLKAPFDPPVLTGRVI